MEICRMNKCLEALVIVLLLVGGLNWGLVGLFNFDLVATLFGAGTFLARLIYSLVGFAAVYKILYWNKSSCHICK